MTDPVKATTRPWKVTNFNGWWSVEGPSGEAAFDDGSAGQEYSPQCSPETRDLIVKAVNSYDAHRTLVEACRRLARMNIGDPPFEDLRKALAALDEVTR